MESNISLVPITHKTCTNCGKYGEVNKDFSRTLGKNANREPSKSSDWHSRCKDCRSKIIGRATLERKLAELPYLYVECDGDDCDNIYNKCHAFCVKCKTPQPKKVASESKVHVSH